MSGNTGLLFGIAFPYLVDHTLPIKTLAAQFNFDDEIQALENRQACQRDNLRGFPGRTLERSIACAEMTAEWARHDALGGQLKTKSQLEAENSKLAEKLAANQAEEVTDGGDEWETDVSEYGGDEGEDRDQGDNVDGGELFGSLVSGSAAVWTGEELIMEQGDFWEEEEEAEEDSMGEEESEVL